MPDNLAFDREYFDSKKRHDRQRVSDISGTAFVAMEIAAKVLRLCYPLRPIRAAHCYYDNEVIEPFLLPEHPTLNVARNFKNQKYIFPRKEYVVVDVYFLFDGLFFSKNESESFAVEVVFPQDPERARWKSIYRVRWIDLGWDKQGNHPGDTPVPCLVGETFVNYWG